MKAAPQGAGERRTKETQEHEDEPTGGSRVSI
jgi:hypothetical protein